jgi:Ni/Co efflux regulator RcnB
MKIPKIRSGLTLAIVFAGLLGSSAVMADKPDRAGGGKNKHSKNEQRDDRPAVTVYFGDSQRMVVRDYYGKPGRSGKCPPGLAKKRNGCVPPGHARRWSKGQPLPRDVVYYPVPQSVVVQLGVPPSGHRYVRVAGDILMIAIGTSMVVDAIQDLGGN